jgi:hypothetical protein
MKYRKYFICLVFLSGCGKIIHPAPTDEKMLKNFSENKSTFLELQSMICQDRFETVSMNPQWSKPEGISEEKKLKYYSLFKKIGVSQLQSYDGCRAQFSFWSMGWAADGDYKSYQYRPSNPENLVESLDNLPLNEKDIIEYHRKIEENWYISYSHWP